MIPHTSQTKTKSFFHAYYLVILGAWILFMGFCYINSLSRTSNCPNWEEAQAELSKYTEEVTARQEQRFQELQKLVVDRLGVIDVKQKSITEIVGRIGRLPQSANQHHIGRLPQSAHLLDNDVRPAVPTESATPSLNKENNSPFFYTPNSFGKEENRPLPEQNRPLPEPLPPQTELSRPSLPLSPSLPLNELVNPSLPLNEPTLPNMPSLPNLPPSLPSSLRNKLRPTPKVNQATSQPTPIENNRPSEVKVEPIPIDYLVPVKTGYKACWTDAYVGFFIPEHSLNYPNRYHSLEEAKSFCKQIGTKCNGVTQTLWNGTVVYEARHDWELRPNPPNQYQETSYIKYSCTRSLVDRVNLYSQNLMETNFFESHFRCESSTASEAKANPQKIERIWVWGERNSGTGMTQRLMTLNFELREEVIGGLPWKHGFMSQQNLHLMQTTLNIFLVKDAYGWLTSMKHHPFHAAAAENTPWPSFLTREWYSVHDTLGEVDRNPYTYKRMANILQLRSAKFKDWIKVRDCLPYHYTLRYEDLIKNTSNVILDIAKKFEINGLRLKPQTPITEVCVVHAGLCRTLGANEKLVVKAKNNFYLSRLYLSEVPDATRKFIAQNLDYESEKLLGYTYPTANDWTYHDNSDSTRTLDTNTTLIILKKKE